MKKGVPLATFDNEEPDSFAHWSPITGNKVDVIQFGWYSID